MNYGVVVIVDSKFTDNLYFWKFYFEQFERQQSHLTPLIPTTSWRSLGMILITFNMFDVCVYVEKMKLVQVFGFCILGTSCVGYGYVLDVYRIVNIWNNITQLFLSNFLIFYFFFDVLHPRFQLSQFEIAIYRSTLPMLLQFCFVLFWIIV